MHDTTSQTPAASAHELATSRYVRLTTFTRDGSAKHTAVWPVDVGAGKVGFITDRSTWKVKRIISSSNRVLLEPSDLRGRVSDTTTPAAGTAEVVTGDAYEAVRRTVKQKYGYQVRLIDLMHRIPGERTGHPTDCAVIVTLDPA